MTDEVIAPVADAPIVEADAKPIEPAAPKERDRTQERIDELTREKHDLKRRLEALEKPKEPEKPLERPTLEQSNYDEDAHKKALDAYYESLIDKKAAEKVEKVLSEREQKEKAAKIEQTFEERLGKLPSDQRERVMRAPADEVMADIIKQSDIGPEIALYLEEHRAEAAEIMKLPPVQKARELGRIEARLEAKATTPAEKPPEVSKAPPPVPKIEAADSSTPVDASSAESDKLSDAEWMRRRKKQVAKQRG